MTQSYFLIYACLCEDFGKLIIHQPEIPEYLHIMKLCYYHKSGACNHLKQINIMYF